MTDKYYIPDISEFFVGFEYEILDLCNRTYLNCRMKLDYDIHTINKHINDSCNHFEEQPIIRVKYLDREDMESLGWKYVIPVDGKCTIDNYYSIIKDYPEPNKTKIEFKLRVFDIGADTVIWSDDTGSTYFDGKIRNKSELKKVLEMIGISQ